MKSQKNLIHRYVPGSAELVPLRFRYGELKQAALHCPREIPPHSGLFNGGQKLYVGTGIPVETLRENE